MTKPNLLHNERGTTPVLGSANMSSPLAGAFKNICLSIGRKHRDHQRHTLSRISARARRVSAQEVIENVNRRAQA